MTIFIHKTRTADLYNFLSQNPGSFYVGRGNGSVLGNPFRAKSNDPSDIAFVVACYRNYLNLVVNADYQPKEAASYCMMQYGAEISDVWWNKPPTKEEVLRMLRLMSKAYSLQESISLVCYCIERPWKKQEVYTDCHAEVVAACIAKLMEMENAD